MGAGLDSGEHSKDGIAWFFSLEQGVGSKHSGTG